MSSSSTRHRWGKRRRKNRGVLSSVCSYLRRNVILLLSHRQRRKTIKQKEKGRVQSSQSLARRKITMAEGKENQPAESIDDLLSSLQDLVPVAQRKAGEVKRFASRWKKIVSHLEDIPQQLSNLSCNPCFATSALCKEQLQLTLQILGETIELAEMCVNEAYEGKLRMQNDLDNLLGKLALNLKDCELLTKTEIHSSVRELLLRLQIGNLEAKHRALDGLMEEEERTILSVMGRRNVASLIQLMTATSPRIREKAVTLISSLAESGSFENWLVSEGVLAPLIRLLESGSSLGKEKAVVSLQRLSTSAETSRAVVGHGGVPPLVEICQLSDSVSQTATVCTLKNISAVPEVRQTLVEEGVIKVMVNLLESETREHAAECLQNLTDSEEAGRQVVSQGGVERLMRLLEFPSPQKSSVLALKNLLSCVPIEKMTSMGLLPRLVHVLRSGSAGAPEAAASTISKICVSMEMKRMAGEEGCVPLLLKLLQGKSGGEKEAAAQAIAVLMAHPQNCREVTRAAEESVPSLVQLLDPNPQNAAKKYAVSCLVMVSGCRKCRKMMIAYGAIGYLKKLVDMEVAGAKRLLQRLEGGRLKNLFMST